MCCFSLYAFNYFFFNICLIIWLGLLFIQLGVYWVSQSYKFIFHYICESFDHYFKHSSAPFLPLLSLSYICIILLHNRALRLGSDWVNSTEPSSSSLTPPTQLPESPFCEVHLYYFFISDILVPEFPFSLLKNNFYICLCPLCLHYEHILFHVIEEVAPSNSCLQTQTCGSALSWSPLGWLPLSSEDRLFSKSWCCMLEVDGVDGLIALRWAGSFGSASY